MGNRLKYVLLGVATPAVAAIVLLAVTTTAGQTPAGQTPLGPNQLQAQLRRLPNGKPDLNGIWQAVNTANWGLEGQGGGPSPVLELGAIGATEAAIRAKLGAPKAVDYNGARWTYETVDGVFVLYLFFAEGKVKIATPDDLPLDAVKRR